MKKIKLLFYSLIFILTSFNSASQIFELTITSKLLGDDVLKVGSTIYIEVDNNTIEYTTGGDGMYVPSVTYTLVMKGISANGVRLNANFNIDNNPWGTPGTITADFSTKKLRFQNWSLEDRAQSGVYYFTYKHKTKEDIAEEKERREKEKLEEKERRVKEKLEEDIQISNQIKEALNKEQYFKANQLIQNLHNKNNDLKEEVNKHFLPLKKEMDVLYAEYLKDFESKRKEYYKNPESFLTKNQYAIKETKEFIDGKEGYMDRIDATTDVELKKSREDLLNNWSFCYKHQDGKKYFAAVGIKPNYYLPCGPKLDHIKLNVKYDTLANSYYSAILFEYKKSRLEVEGIIVNKTEFSLKKYEHPFEGDLNILANKATKQGSKNFIESFYPKKVIHFDNVENITVNKLNEISTPDEGIKNDMFDKLSKSYDFVNNDISKYASKDLEIIAFASDFYNPSILYLVKKMYPTADTLIFALGDFRKSLGKQAIHLPKHGYRAGSFGSIIPLQKGIVEFNNDTLIVFKKDGNYSEYKVDKVIPQSILSLSKLKIEDIKMDSAFYSKPNSSDLIDQHPIRYVQVQLGYPDKYEPNNRTYSNRRYYYNDSICFQRLQTYNTTNLYRNVYEEYWPSNFILTGEYAVFSIYHYRVDAQDSLKRYLYLITDYFEYKKSGDIKKANRKLRRAEKKLENFKSKYFNPN